MRVAVTLGLVLCVACGQHNPDSCCTTLAQCASFGLEMLYPCASDKVCDSTGACVPPQCDSSADCTDPTKPVCVDRFCVSQTCFGPEGWQACYVDLPSTQPDLATTIDTSVGSSDCQLAPMSWTSAGQPDACFVVGTTINVPTDATVTGSRPIVLVATSISVVGMLDVASHNNLQTRGPASPSTQCKGFIHAPMTVDSAGGGGAGAAFMTLAGDGGKADNNLAAGGAAPGSDPSLPTKLRAGCDGQQGATGLSTAGPSGVGGGAVYLLANTITVTGIINAFRKWCTWWH